MENSERGATPTGLKSPTLTSTPITEPATKSTSSEKEEESKPEPGDGRTVTPGELKERGAKHPKSTKVAARSQGRVNAKSKGALKLKRQPPSSSVTAPETSSPTESRSEVNTNVGGDTEDGDTNANLPGSSTGGRNSANGDESKRSKRGAESDHLPSSTKVPVVEDSSAVKESSELPPEKADGKQKENDETSLKHGSDQKNGFQSGSVGTLEYVTQPVLQDSTTVELKQSTEAVTGAGSSSSTERHPEGTVASYDGKDRDQMGSFSDVQLQEFHESLPAVSGGGGGGGDGSESTSEREVESGMQRLTQDSNDQVSEEVAVIQEGEHVASSEPEQSAHTTNDVKEKSKPAASSSLPQTVSPPSADSATGSAVTASDTQPTPFSTCNEGSLQTPVSASPTGEQKRGSTSSEKAVSSSPWQPSSSQETTAVLVTKEKEMEGEEREQPLIDQEELEKLKKVC